MSNELEKSIKHVFDRAKEMGDWYEDESPHITKKLNEDIELVEQALKRNEPVKPKTKAYSNGFFKWFVCSVCDTNIQKEFVYCPNCGQKLDWSDDNE